MTVSAATINTILTVMAVIGIPATIFGAWKGVVGLVHMVDAIKRVANKLDKETMTNGATTAAQKSSDVLHETVEPSIKDLLSAIIVTNNHMVDQLESMATSSTAHDTNATARTKEIIAVVERSIEANTAAHEHSDTQASATGDQAHSDSQREA